MNGLKSRRDGFALAAAVLAMLVVGAIVTGGFYAASQESSIAKSTDAGNMALYIAETGLNATLASAQARTLENMADGATNSSASNTPVSYGGTTVGGYSWQITRMTEYLYIVRSTGRVTLEGPYSGATRTLAAVVRLKKAEFDNNTALQVYGNLTVGGSSAVNGADYQSTAWSDCDSSATSSAVTANPTSTISTSGGGQINGTTSRTAMDSADFNVFGEVGFDEIAEMANYTFPVNETVGPEPQWLTLNGITTCQTNVSTQDNWGAPTNPLDPCYSWFPIIHAEQDLRISSSGTGQGVLLVDGNLEVSGGFTFYGVVVVRGQIRMTGTGGHINGTLLTYGDGELSSTSTTLGNSVVQYSSCAIERAALGSQIARLIPVKDRSWLDMSSIQNSY